MKLASLILGICMSTTSYCQVVLFDNVNFTGNSKSLTPGNYRIFDFNDLASSIKIPPGMVAVVFEHADDGGGYGTSVDFLEDCNDLSRYHFDNNISYVTVMNAFPPGFVWARNNFVNGQFISGHWERQRANGSLPPNNGPIVSPFYPPHGPGLADCNPGHCLDLLDKAEALAAGAVSSYFPTADEIRPVTDSIILAFKQTPEGKALLAQYDEEYKEYKNRHDWWTHLPPLKRDQIEEPRAPENPLSGNKYETLKFQAITILKSRNRFREIEIAQQDMRNCQCDMIGYGSPTPVLSGPSVINDVRVNLPAFTDNILFNKAENDQMGIIGSDYKPKQNIGSACFEREFTGGGWGELLDILGASNINFWFPQKRIKENGHYKQTLAGRLEEIHEANIEDILPDHDVNIDIAPSANYTYLLSEGHKPELTNITSLAMRRNGETPQCPERFFTIEAEIDARDAAKGMLISLNRSRLGQTICLYGPWIYDAGHCDQPEIHPAEQIWWSTTDPTYKRQYYCNLYCDASKRYWWRNQMDDGTKIKPWGAPPIEGTFAIAFEVIPGRPAKLFEVSELESFNVAGYGYSEKTYNLVYNNQTLVSFAPYNSAFTNVSFEKLGMSGNKIKGFLVFTVTVGSVRQKATEVQIGRAGKLSFPLGIDVNKINQRYEPMIFEKKEGDYMFYITRSNYNR